MQRQLNEQDKRVRQLEAGETVLCKRVQEQDETIRRLRESDLDKEGFATQDNLEESIEEVKSALEAFEHSSSDLLAQFNTKLRTHIMKTRRELDTIATTTGDLTASIEEQDSRHEEQLRAAERRWENELNRVERSLEERTEEQESHTLCKEYFDNSLQETMERLQLVGFKDTWSRELDRRDQQRREEWDKALQQRLTHEQLTASFTSLEMTRAIVDRLADFQATTDQQHHRLHAGLSTLERLFLRQMDAAARMVCRLQLIRLFH